MTSSSLFIFPIRRQLTGLWPFYENEDDTIVHGKVMAGERPYVDHFRYNSSSSSWEERRLVEVMLRGWEHDPNSRIDIFEAVRLLRQPKPDG